MTDNGSDRHFAEQALKRLPAEVPSAGFETALLAAYDGWNAQRRQGLLPAFQEGLRRFSQAIWPGAPIWAPTSAFALALLLGAGLGASLPGVVAEDEPVFSLEQPVAFSLSAPGAPQEDL